MLGEEMVLQGRLILSDQGVAIELDDEAIWYLDFEIRVHGYIGPRKGARCRAEFDRLTASHIEVV